MIVLGIPDVHLREYMFKRAAEIMRSRHIDVCVCFMDIADDWGRGNDIEAYIRAYDAAIEFAKEFPNTLWCWGNHDISYIWKCIESGYSVFASDIVREKIIELIKTLPDPKQMAFIHRLDNVLFMHGGLTASFVKCHIADLDRYDDVDAVIEGINLMGQEELWSDWSPLWYRPQGTCAEMYKSDTILQVVGHTPVRSIKKDEERNFISCDVFSTDSLGRPIGSSEYILLNTETWEFEGIK